MLQCNADCRVPKSRPICHRVTKQSSSPWRPPPPTSPGHQHPSGAGSLVTSRIVILTLLTPRHTPALHTLVMCHCFVAISLDPWPPILVPRLWQARSLLKGRQGNN